MTRPDTVSEGDRTALRRGLSMSHPLDAEKMAAERAHLASLETAPISKRVPAYLKLVGPGYLQSAMTLGGGTAAFSLFAGAVFGYQLLWVAPLSMILGMVMLTAVAHQTLSTGVRPFEAMKRFAGAPLAWGWAIGAIVASIIWHFPQYALASAFLVDLGSVAGVMPESEEARQGITKWMGIPVLLWAVVMAFLYASSPNSLRWYERLLKYMVWGIVVCFGIVVIRTGISDWGALFRGFVPSIPGERGGTTGATLVISGLAAAVGINMVFLYPYSLLARGWSREHRRLAKFDLLSGMFLPYVLASCLMVIATANTIHVDPDFDASTLSAGQAAKTLAGVLGPTFGRVVFDIGIVGMALSTISLHMIACGFVCSEIFDWPFGSRKYKIATLFPAVGVLGPVLWSKYAVWIAVPTNIACGLLLPIAYVGFIILQGKRAYLGDDLPRGTTGTVWRTAMIAITLFLTGFLTWFVVTNLPDYLGKLGS